jgi:adenine phosphoribosyltransferase
MMLGVRMTDASVDPVANSSCEFASMVPEVGDFPIPGIRFKDISPLLAQPTMLSAAVDALMPDVVALRPDTILAVDARGFVLGACLADRLRTGFVMVRKPGKLPGDRHVFSYCCEYSTGSLEVTRGSVKPEQRCLIVDDVLATGGTARATADFAMGVGGIVCGFAFLLEIRALGGRLRLTEGPVLSVIKS